MVTLSFNNFIIPPVYICLLRDELIIGQKMDKRQEGGGKAKTGHPKNSLPFSHSEKGDICHLAFPYGHLKISLQHAKLFRQKDRSFQPVVCSVIPVVQTHVVYSRKN